MSLYTPDGWVVLKITIKDDIHFRVFGSWSGSYLWGDNWKLNSGITSVEYDDQYLYFYGNSGSCYKCGKHGGRISAHNHTVLSSILGEGYAEQIEIDDLFGVLMDHGIEVKEKG